MISVILEKISVFFKRAFCCFSLVTVAMALVGMAENKQDDISYYISVDLIISFFLFSLLLALSFCISDLIKNNNVLRRAAQFVLTYLSAVVVLFGAFGDYVKANNVQNPGYSMLMLSFCFVIIYALCGVVALIFGVIKSKIANENKEYKEMFDNK